MKNNDNKTSLSELFKDFFNDLKNSMGLVFREDNYIKFLKFLATPTDFDSVLKKSKWANKTPFFAGKKPLTSAERKIIKQHGFETILQVSRNLYFEVDSFFGKSCQDNITTLEKVESVASLAQKFTPVIKALIKAAKPLRKFIEQQDKLDLDRLKKHFSNIYHTYNQDTSENPEQTKNSAYQSILGFRDKIMRSNNFNLNSLSDYEHKCFQFLIKHYELTKNEFGAQKVKSF